MENTNATATVNTPVTTTEVGDNSRQQRRTRERERFHAPVKDFNELDPAQFPQRPREERVPMWAQQMQKSIDLLSQEQQKLADKLTAIEAEKAKALQPDIVAEAAKIIEAVNGLKKLSEDNFSKVRENQKHSYDHTMGAMHDIMTALKDFLAKQEPAKEVKHGFFWYILNPKTALKDWWQRKAAARRQRKAEKLEAQLKALRGAK